MTRISKSSHRKCSIIKLLFEISQNSQEHACVGVFATLIKNRLQHRCFPANFGEFFKTSFSIEHLPATASCHPYIDRLSTIQISKQEVPIKTLKRLLMPNHFKLMKKHIQDADVYLRICQTSMMEFFLKAG